MSKASQISCTYQSKGIKAHTVIACDHTLPVPPVHHSLLKEPPLPKPTNKFINQVTKCVTKPCKWRPHLLLQLGRPIRQVLIVRLLLKLFHPSPELTPPLIVKKSFVSSCS